MNQNKRIILSILVAVLLIGLVGMTFAAYTYVRTGTSNSKQLVGDIYMHYTESNTLTLDNAMPSKNYIENKYFEFTIDGKNTTTNKDIYFDISLTHGSVPTGKTEANRILDKFLRFRLVEVINNEEVEIFTNKNYIDLTNKRVFVETIPKNTTSHIEHTYRIYMWISKDVVIGNVNQDYTELEWSNLFASIKVNVTGDFNEKEVTTDESCFLVSYNYVVNTNMTNEEIQTCSNYLNNDLGYTWDTGESIEAYCNGTGTLWGTTFQYTIDSGDFNFQNLHFFEEHNIIVKDGLQTIGYDSSCEKDVIIPSKLPITTYTLNSNLTTEDIQTCVQYTVDNNWYFDAGETAEAYCNGTGTRYGLTFQENLNNYWVNINKLKYFEEHNIISKSESIERYNIKAIGAYSFTENQLTSVKIPNSVTKINECAFDRNNLRDIIIPDGVTSIEYEAFHDNQIECVSLSNNTEYDSTSFDDTVTIHQGDDFVCPIIVKDSCFTGSVENNQVTIIDYDIGCGLDVVIPSKIHNYPVTTLVKNAFNTVEPCVNYDCEFMVTGKGIKSVDIPHTVTTIGDYAFFDNQITSVTLPNSITNIGISTFQKNKITNVILENGITNLGYGTFSENLLTEINIPNSVTSIGEYVFSKNQLSNVSLPNNITSIGTGAFEKNQLTNINLPNSITSIGNFAFDSNKLTSINIPNNLSIIKYSTFSNNLLTSISIPNEVTTIESGAFSNNRLTSISIPNTVREIGTNAFSKNQLTSVDISNGVLTIGSDAFSMNLLTSINIPNSVTTIGSGAFRNNLLTSVTIGNGISSIGLAAFSKDYNHTVTYNDITYYDNPNLTSITIDKSCSDIRTNLKYNNKNYYPWLSSISPYIGIGGVTIYGSNNEVCTF